MPRPHASAPVRAMETANEMVAILGRLKASALAARPRQRTAQKMSVIAKWSKQSVSKMSAEYYTGFREAEIPFFLGKDVKSSDTLRSGQRKGGER